MGGCLSIAAASGMNHRRPHLLTAMQKIPKPNYTQVPNVLLDGMFEFTHTEFKVLMLVCRQTFGFHREQHRLSYSFIERGCGLSHDAVYNALKTLCFKGVLMRTIAGDSFEYEVCLGDVASTPIGQGVVRQTDYPLVRHSDTKKETRLKKPLKQRQPLAASIPKEQEFNSYLMDCCHQIAEYRPHLFKELTDANWLDCHQKPIQDWKAYVSALEAKIKCSMSGNF